jgi:hypothetical protein
MADLTLRLTRSLWRRFFPELSDEQAKVLATVKFPCC